MTERAVVFLFSLLVVVAALGTSGWLIASGQAAYLDGRFLIAACLVIALAFGLYVLVLVDVHR
jgi:hypothetical protein